MSWALFGNMKNKFLLLIFILLVAFVYYQVTPSKKLSDYLPINIKSYSCSSYQEAKMPISKANKIFDFLKNNYDRFEFSKTSCLSMNNGPPMTSLPYQAYDFKGDKSFRLSLYSFSNEHKVLQFEPMVNDQKIFFLLRSIEAIKKFEGEIKNN